jgi:hypothetical protein
MQQTLLHPRAFLLSAVSACLGLLIAFASSGCRSVSGPGSASFASVTIANHSAEEIAKTNLQVFGAEGYRGGMSGPGQMIFQREASRATTLSREGLVATHEGAQTQIRVRAEIVELAGGTFRLQCKAFVVTGGSDPFFQDEVAMTNIRSGPYQSLLNKVAKELK